MTPQSGIFGGAGGARETAAALPDDFRHKPGLIGLKGEAAPVACVRELPFRDFEFHGHM